MISPLANVSPKAKIGNNVTISAFATIYENVEIGDDTFIHPNALIYPDTIIGTGCQIFPGAVIGITSQDLKYKGEKSKTVIGNNTIIREYATVHKGTADRMLTSVGNNTMLMAYSHVAHDCIIGNNVILANFVGLAGHVTIQDFVIAEGYTAIQQFVTVGEHCFLGACSQVRKNVPPYIRVAREPLQYVGVNTVGLARRGFNKEVINLIEDIYRLIFVRGHNVTKALELVDLEIADSKIKTQIINFIKSSKEGIIKGI